MTIVDIGGRDVSGTAQRNVSMAMLDILFALFSWIAGHGRIPA